MHLATAEQNDVIVEFDLDTFVLFFQFNILIFYPLKKVNILPNKMQVVSHEVIVKFPWLPRGKACVHLLRSAVSLTFRVLGEKGLLIKDSSFLFVSFGI